MLLQEVSFGTVLVLVVEHNGCLTNAVCNAICVQDDLVVAQQANGRCCYWCVPDNVYKVTFEIGAAVAAVPGHTCCNNCSFAIGGAGGNYAIKTINTNPDAQHSVCAGGSWSVVNCHMFTQAWDVNSMLTDTIHSTSCNRSMWRLDV